MSTSGPILNSTEDWTHWHNALPSRRLETNTTACWLHQPTVCLNAKGLYSFFNIIWVWQQYWLFPRWPHKYDYYITQDSRHWCGWLEPEKPEILKGSNLRDETRRVHHTGNFHLWLYYMQLPHKNVLCSLQWSQLTCCSVFGQINTGIIRLMMFAEVKRVSPRDRVMFY